ncbi:MAG: hypothetical protein ACJ74Q_09330 [Pyrinomonadaceae bacterium]
MKEFSADTAGYVAETLRPVAGEPEQSAGRSGALHLSARRLLTFMLMSLVFVLAVRTISDPDFWWHLRAGQLIWETRSIPHSDVFSSTFFGREWVAHEWVSEALMYAIHRAAGYAGLVVVFALVISAAMWVALRGFAARAGHPYVAGFALLLGALAASPTWGVRPQMFSFLFASIFFAVLDGYARGESRSKVWWLVPLTVLWVNMHAGFALGLTLIVLTIAGLLLDAWLSEGESREPVGGRVRTLAAVLVACLAAVALNPNGARLYVYPFETLTSHAMMKYINEWFSPDFHEPMFQPLALMLLATFASMCLSRERVRPSSLLLLAATAYAALRSGRNVPFFALASMPLLAEHTWMWLSRQAWGARLLKPEKTEGGSHLFLKVALNVFVFVFVPLALCLVKVQHVAARRAADEAQNFPSAAVEFIRENRLPQPIFNEYGWGGYMIWKLQPDYRVYIDGRADVYGDAFMEEFLKTHDGVAAWRAPLEREGVRTVAVGPDTPLASLLRQEKDWRNVFEDKQAVIFVRD